MRALAAVRAGGIGDVLLCTPGLRAVKRRDPSCRITFHTDCPELLRGLPYIDEVRPTGEAPAAAVFLAYEDTIPPRGHLARRMAEGLSVAVRDVVPDCAIRADLVARYRAAWGAGPNLVVQRRASRHTPNKDWPMARWNALLDRLSRRWQVIEIGQASADAGPDAGPEAGVAPGGRYRDLRGRTAIGELVAAVAAADGFVGPVSGPAHIAAAARRPAVVILGGYEAAENTAYPTQHTLAATPPCSPCWLRTQCPHGLACLTAISVEAVAAAVARALAGAAAPREVVS